MALTFPPPNLSRCELSQSPARGEEQNPVFIGERVNSGRLLKHALRAHDSRTPARLAAHQAQAQRRLRDLAVARSPFHRRLHRGLEHRPLPELPILTKGELMTHDDEVVTDPAVRLEDVRAHLNTSGGAVRA